MFGLVPFLNFLTRKTFLIFLWFPFVSEGIVRRGSETTLLMFSFSVCFVMGENQAAIFPSFFPEINLLLNYAQRQFLSLTTWCERLITSQTLVSLCTQPYHMKDRLTDWHCKSAGQCFLNELLITTQWAPILWWFTVTCVSCAKPHISFRTSVWISQNHLFCTWFSKIRNYHDLFFAIGLTTCFLALNFV